MTLAMAAATRNRHELSLRAFALSFPGTHEDFPWGHRALKVRGKAFVFMSRDEPGLSLSVKLPASAEGALQFGFCEPTHYGLGRSGWVTATFAPRARVPVDMLRSWIGESYRAVASKKLVSALDTPSAGARGAASRSPAGGRKGATASARPRSPARRRRAAPGP
jgi:predicted DNA-binding protein (MmcQ/YjbR family)